MTIQFSEAVRNARLNAWEATIGVAARLRLYSGVIPANCAAALASGSLMLAEYELESNWAADAAGGSKTLNSLPLTTTGTGDAGGGTDATFYRIYDTAGAVCHEQGTVTIIGASPLGDLVLDNPNIATGQDVEISTLTKIEPGA